MLFAVTSIVRQLRRRGRSNYLLHVALELVEWDLCWDWDLRHRSEPRQSDGRERARTPQPFIPRASGLSCAGTTLARHRPQGRHALSRPPGRWPVECAHLASSSDALAIVRKMSSEIRDKF